METKSEIMNLVQANVTRRLFVAGGAGLLSAIGLGYIPQSHAEGKVIAISFPNSSKIGAVITSLEQSKVRGKELGYTVIVDDPGTDLNKQVNTIKTWIEQKVAVIVCVVLQPDVFISLAKQAHDAGIFWITYGDKIQNQDATVGYAQYDDGRRLGEYAGKWVNENLGGKANVAVLGYEKGSWGQLRGNGIKEGLKSVAPGVTIAVEQDAITPTEGLNVTRTILQAHPEINVILGVEDPATEGAYKAWVASGRDPKQKGVFIGGMDGTVPALTLLKAGDNIYQASMAIPLKAVGDAIVETADKLIKEGKAPDNIVPLELVTPGSPAADKYLKEQGAQ